MLDPHAGRAQVTESDQSLRISIPAKRQIFLTAFLGVWLAGWAVGWVFAVSVLLFGAPGVAAFFLIFWLFFWTIGGLAALSVVLWNLAGREELEMTRSTLTVARRIPFWSRKTVCNLSEIGNFRIAEAETQPEPDKQTTPGIWASRDIGTLRFDYGLHTLGFGVDLGATEAQHLLGKIADRYERTAEMSHSPISDTDETPVLDSESAPVK